MARPINFQETLQPWRNALEFAVIFLFWFFTQRLIASGWFSATTLVVLIIGAAWAKTAFFALEDLQQLWQASLQNLPYHRFMLLMFVNMTQIIASFGLDFHCLHCTQPASFGSVNSKWSTAELIFEFFYYSVLNFTFFGYGDMTPQTVPAKILTMTEIFLAFVTVIFLLSDFISLKESIVRDPTEPRT